MATAKQFVDLLVQQEGDTYRLGHEVKLKDPNPDIFDCSELIEWGAHQVGVFMPDYSGNQIAYCEKKGTVISVDEAVKTRGALLWHEGHVAISLGNGKTIEAMNTERGVVIGNAKTSKGHRFTKGALIPDLEYPNKDKKDKKDKEDKLVKPPFKRTLEAGDKSEQVRYVQTVLAKLGFHTGRIDGIYGTMTSKAVRKFQAEKGLKVTGIVKAKDYELL